VNRQSGMSSLALVLLLLIMGSLILTGLNQQLNSFTRIVSKEHQLILHRAAVQSAMEWGKAQLWSVSPNIQCKYSQQARVCVRLLGDERVLLVAGDSEVMLWRGGEIQNGRIVFSPHGWSDFCPLKEGVLCRLL